MEAVIDDGDDDPAVITRALSTIARTQNSSRIDRGAGISREGLYRALSADGNPSLATVIAVAHTLGLRLRLEVAS